MIIDLRKGSKKDQFKFAQRLLLQDDEPYVLFNGNNSTPNSLSKIDIIWKIALKSQKEVASESIGFFLNYYLSLSVTNNMEKRIEIIDNLIKKIFEYIEQEEQSPNKDVLERLIRILIKLIEISDKIGLKIEPHNALLQGELLNRIVVRYMVTDIGFSGSLRVERNFFVKTYSSTTVWELKI